MRNRICWALGIVCATAVHAQVRVEEPVPQIARVDVNVSEKMGNPIPRTIFGTFLEPIGNSTYNGLWAEILENPGFESGLWSAQHVADMLHERPELSRASDLDLPLPWEPLNAAQGNRYERRYGDAANSWQSLVVMAVPGEPSGIKQRVYLPVHRTRSYKGSFYARHLSGSTKVTVSLRMRGNDEALVAQNVDVSNTGTWQKYEFALEVPEGRLHRLDPADFAVQLDVDERVELDQFSLMPTDAEDGLDPDEVAMAKAMHTPLVRFGGNYTSGYHWRDGVGERDKRRNMLNHSWGIPEYNTFGTDEFLAFCKRIGAEPQIALNLGTGTPEEAAGWVKYVDEHWHAGLLWELGNELWGNWNLGYPAKSELAARTLKFSQAVKAVDATARLIATGADPDGFKEWNGIQLTNPPGTFDFLSTHFVVGDGDVKLAHASPEFVQEAAFAMPAELERRLKEQQQQIDSAAGKAHIAFTEWLFLGGRRHGAPDFTNTAGAIVTGGFLNMLMRNAEIVPLSDMTGIMEFGGIWKKRSQVYATPAYYVFKMYAGADAAQRVAVRADSGSYSVKQGVERLPEIASVPYLDVVATLSQNGRKLTLFCVNRSAQTDIAAQLNLQGFKAAAKAKVQVLTSDTLSDANDEVEPERVMPLESTEAIAAGGWSHTFPHASVTVLTIDRR
ncbi:MAG TPA: alpha-L-arabinofuranosidase C-terminal domain-containing protein [Terracidiphilus sp.]